MDAGAGTTVFLPDTHAGCVVEMGFHIRALLDASLPEVSESLEVQRGIPVKFKKRSVEMICSGLGYRVDHTAAIPAVRRLEGLRQHTDFGKFVQPQKKP